MAFEFKERGIKSSKKSNNPGRNGNPPAEGRKQAEIEGGWLPSGLLNCSLPIPILSSSPFWVLLGKEAGGKTELWGQKEPQRSQSIRHPHYTDGEAEAQRGTVARLLKRTQQRQNQVLLGGVLSCLI